MTQDINNKEPEQETLEFDGCHMWILRRKGKVAIGIEQPKPEALIMIVGLIHILGEPLFFSHEEGDNFVLFGFKDKNVENDVTEAWRQAFATKTKE